MTRNRHIIPKFKVVEYLRKVSLMIGNNTIRQVFTVYDIKTEFIEDNRKLGAILRKAQNYGLVESKGKIKIGPVMIKQYSLSIDGLKEVKRCQTKE